MRILLIPLLFILYYSHAQQKAAIDRSSSYALVYKLSYEEARTIYKKGTVSIVDESYFHSLVDSIPANGKFRKEYPVGNYLLVQVTNGQVYISLAAKSKLYPEVIRDPDGFVLKILNEEGHVVSDAIVKLNKKLVAFDSKTNSYKLEKTTKEGFLQINHPQGQLFYEVDNGQDGPVLLKSMFEVAIRKPIQFLYKKIQRSYDGYLVFNKPRYLPGDTVRLKAFLVKKKHYNKSALDLKLISSLYSKTIFTKKIKPVSKGAYVYDFILGDTLELNRFYNVQIGNSKFFVKNYFYLEEYQLDENIYSILPERKTYFLGDTVKFTIRAEDMNGNTVSDSKVELSFEVDEIYNFYQPKVYVPFVLWKEEAEIPNGELEIRIPDAILPLAHFSGKLNARFVNSNNEVQVLTSTVQINRKPQRLEVKLNDDKIEAAIIQSKKELSGEGMMYVFSYKDTLSVQNISYPYSGLINPLASKYIFEYNNLKEIVTIYGLSHKVTATHSRTKDSVLFKINNPVNLEFNYAIYKGKKKIKEGSSKELQFNCLDKSKSDYFVKVQFVWAGILRKEEYFIGYENRHLNIAVSQPKKVVPGEEVSVEINVTNDFGRPVKDVNLTAFSVNSQFGKVDMPRLFKNEKTDNNGYTDNHYSKSIIEPYKSIRSITNDCMLQLDMDSTLYYQFKYPGSNGFYYYDSLIVTQAQFAPHIVENGRERNIVRIKVDNELVYYHYNNRDNAPYSFVSSPGYHKIELLLSDREITIDSVLLKENTKLEFSLDLHQLPENASMVSHKKKLNKQERIELLNNVILLNTYSYSGLISDGIRTNLVNNYLFDFAGVFHGTTYFIDKDNNERYKFEPGKSYRLHSTKFSEKEFSRSDRKNLYKSKLIFDKYQEERYREIAYTKEHFKIKSKHSSAPTYYSFKANTTNPGNATLFVVYPKEVKEVRIEGNNFIFYQLNGYENILYNVQPGNYSIVLIDKDQMAVYSETIELKAEQILLLNYFDVDFQRRVTPSGRSSNVVSKKVMWEAEKRRSNYQPYLYVYQNSYGSDLDIDLHIFFNTIPTLFSKGRRIANTSLGPSINATWFNGDIASYYRPSKGFGIHYTTKFRARWYMQKEFSFIQLKGNDNWASSGSTEYLRGLNFRNNMWMYSVSTLCDVFKNKGGYTKRKQFNLYGKLGLSIYYSNPKQYENGQWHSLRSMQNEGVKYSAFQGAVQTGAGGRWRVSRFIDLDISYTKYWAFTDYLDDVSKRGNPGKDQFGFLSLKVNYIFPQRIISPKFRDGAGYMASPSDHWEVAKGQISSDEKVLALVNVELLDENQSHRVKRKAEAKLEDTNESSGENDIRLRSVFLDYAYWQPNLITDKSGHASFRIKYPDNITSWNSYFIGMNRKSGGIYMESVKSFRPLSVSLYTPKFLIEGDTVYVIAKVNNHTGDSLSIHTNGQGVSNTRENDYKIGNYFTEEFRMHSTNAKDTLEAKYLISSENGYKDGEKRTIPVQRKGVIENTGNFYVLNRDTTFTITLDSTKGSARIFVDNDPLEVLLKEIKAIKEYEYYCMEQTASKLNALLMEKQILEQLDEKFQNDNSVRKLIKKLHKGRNAEGLWSWWDNGYTDKSMTLYIANVLLKAANNHYNVPSEILSVKYSRLADKSLSLTDFRMLVELDSASIKHKVIDSLIGNRFQSTHDKVELIRIKQLLGLSYTLDELFKLKKKTHLGGSYYGTDGTGLFDNHVQTTVLAYQVLKQHGGMEKELESIRNYFFEIRGSSSWRNTYESARILETILPDLLVMRNVKESNVEISADVKHTITQFPFTAKIDSKGAITVSKKGITPAYISCTQEWFNTKPEKNSKAFQVSTKFNSNGEAVDMLQSGQSYKMTVEVKTDKSGEYVMITVPIPAGCFYDPVYDVKNRYEVHREYARDKVIIYCRNLPPGKYEFSIALTARFKGRYNLNPAEVKLMYFPSVFGREGMKKVVIE